MNYQTEVPKLIAKLRISKKTASDIIGITYVGFNKKENQKQYNKFTEKDYSALVNWAKEKKV